MSEPNPADRHIDLILECFADGMNTAQTAKLINKRYGTFLTEAQIANTLSKYRDQLSLETEIRLSTGF
jgi:ATP-dependent helicase/DNAse subunit B